MGPTVSLWINPGRERLVDDELTRVAKLLDPKTLSHQEFAVSNTAPIGGATKLKPPRLFGTSVEAERFDEEELSSIRQAVGFVPSLAVGIYSPCNDMEDHRALGEIAFSIAQNVDALIDFCGSLGEVSAATGRLVAIPYETAPGKRHYYHGGDAAFMKCWLVDPNSHLVK